MNLEQLSGLLIYGSLVGIAIVIVKAAVRIYLLKAKETFCSAKAKRKVSFFNKRNHKGVRPCNR